MPKRSIPNPIARIVASGAVALSCVVSTPVAAQEVPVNAATVAIHIDLAGRQRMLAERMASQFCYARSQVDTFESLDELKTSVECLAAGGFELDATLPELEATLKLFDRSLGAFLEGLPVAGVPKPPTDEISAQLAVANATWSEISYIPQTIVTGGSLGLRELSVFRQGASKFLREMNQAVAMLTALKTNGS